MSGPPDIVIAGAGPWGLATAWAAAAAGARVHVLDDGRPPAAHVAAGMLGSHSEAEEGERDMFALLVRAGAAWPGFAGALGEATGMDPGHRVTGALAVAARPEHIAVLRRRVDLLASWGEPVSWATPSELRRIEPGLGTAVSGGLDLPDEHQVQPRALLGALRAAALSAGVRVHPVGAAAVLRDDLGRPVGLTDLAGEDHRAGVVVIAAGHGTRTLAAGAGVRPVKGQVLRLRATEHAPVPIARTVRTPSVYLAPRDGEVVVGATSEQRSDGDVTARGVHELLDEALHVVPELGELTLAEAAAGLRPATRDGRPMIGRTPDGLVVATGGYRNGVLLTPLAGRAAADVALGRPAPEWASPPPPDGSHR